MWWWVFQALVSCGMCVALAFGWNAQAVAVAVAGCGSSVSHMAGVRALFQTIFENARKGANA